MIVLIVYKKSSKLYDTRLLISIKSEPPFRASSEKFIFCKRYHIPHNEFFRTDCNTIASRLISKFRFIESARIMYKD